MNLDGWVDVVVWGLQDNKTNCIVSYLYSPNSTNNTFVSGPQYTGINQTSNPFVISYGKSNAEKSIGLLLFLNGNRAILNYQNTTNL